ncbi:MAG: polyprenyl synthetase family protein [Polyangiaceae bacterium]|nr:polyprenyl synthetase family protein [Polyangiaceae bacterium]
MSLSLQSAVAILGESLHPADETRRLAAHVAEVEALLEEDMTAFEGGLREAVSVGPEPATHAAVHLVSRGGKRVRPVALLLSAACFGPIPRAARELAIAAELVHSATLLHDDVVDEGMDRRGAPTARRLWGNAVSVLAGDLLLAHALERTLAVAPGAMPDLVATLRRLVDGEIVQLRGRRSLDMSEATYERILRDKTASLFGWSTKAGARLGGANRVQRERFGTFGERLGVAFQLVDDVLDYSGESTGKTLLADLAEGKVTLPLVLTVRWRPEVEAEVRRIHAGDSSNLAWVRQAVLESGACEEVRRRARLATERAVSALSGVPEGAARALLEGVARELAGRAT